MIIINTQDIECTLKQELRDHFGNFYGENNLRLKTDQIFEHIIACGNDTPAEKPIDRVNDVLTRWLADGFVIDLANPNTRGRLIGELVRACLGIDSPTHNEASSAGECPDDKS